MSGLRVLVCGGRSYTDVHTLHDVLDSIHASTPIACIIHGNYTGADQLAGEWAIRHGVTVSAYPADWKRDGRAAGPIRNQRMLTEGRPDLVVAFEGGRGTADMVARARKAGLEVIGGRILGESEMREAAEAIETLTCEACDKRVLFDDAVYSEGCYFCPQCFAEWKAEFDACTHDWEAHVSEMGDDGYICRTCSGFVATEDFPALGLQAPATMPTND